MATKQPSSFTELHGNSRRPGRFSLLFMEHGEYMLSDLSVVRFDVPEATGSWVQAVRTNGRLKVCTRGLVFEPAAGARAPIVRVARRDRDVAAARAARARAAGAHGDIAARTAVRTAVSARDQYGAAGTAAHASGECVAPPHPRWTVVDVISSVRDGFELRLVGQVGRGAWLVGENDRYQPMTPVDSPLPHC